MCETPPLDCGSTVHDGPPEVLTSPQSIPLATHLTCHGAASSTLPNNRATVPRPRRHRPPAPRPDGQTLIKTMPNDDHPTMNMWGGFLPGFVAQIFLATVLRGHTVVTQHWRAIIDGLLIWIPRWGHGHHPRESVSHHGRSFWPKWFRKRGFHGGGPQRRTPPPYIIVVVQSPVTWWTAQGVRFYIATEGTKLPGLGFLQSPEYCASVKNSIVIHRSWDREDGSEYQVPHVICTREREQRVAMWPHEQVASCDEGKKGSGCHVGPTHHGTMAVTCEGARKWTGPTGWNLAQCRFVLLPFLFLLFSVFLFYFPFPSLFQIHIWFRFQI
jgi:hypothetical protein